MPDILNCEFSEPVEIATNSWSFSKLNCSSAAIDLLSDGTSNVYLEKTLSYGDYFVIFFAVVIILAGILDFIFRFIYKIKVNFRH